MFCQLENVPIQYHVEEADHVRRDWNERQEDDVEGGVRVVYDHQCHHSHQSS